MSANLDIIRATYEGSLEENGRNLMAVQAPDAMWIVSMEQFVDSHCVQQAMQAD